MVRRNVLRTELERSPNVRCIFAGGQRHLLLDLFNDAKNPFFCNADQVELQHIDRAIYAAFVVAVMKRHKRTLKLEEAMLRFDICRGHTYYLQALFNRLFSDPKPLERATNADVPMLVVSEQDTIMATLRIVLTKNQQDLFAAIARECEVETPTAGAFIKKHDLPSSAAVVHAIHALVDRELIYVKGYTENAGKPIYVPHNPFMGAWFRYRKLPPEGSIKAAP